MKDANEDWVPMSEAAKVVGVSTSKISRLAAKGKIQTKLNLKDERVKLVNITELKAYFSGEIHK